MSCTWKFPSSIRMLCAVHLPFQNLQPLPWSLPVQNNSLPSNANAVEIPEEDECMVVATWNGS
ncbi:hypothetical protein FRX31_004480, partial [Thalictrum thalictroides]